MTPLDRAHPIRTLLDQASLGTQPTTEQLDKFLNRPDLPDGHDLARFRARLVRAAAEVGAVKNAGDYQAARRLGDQRAAELAADMTAPEAGIATTDPTPEDVDTITARMFTRY